MAPNKKGPLSQRGQVLYLRALQVRLRNRPHLPSRGFILGQQILSFKSHPRKFNLVTRLEQWKGRAHSGTREGGQVTGWLVCRSSEGLRGAVQPHTTAPLRGPGG